MARRIAGALACLLPAEQFEKYLASKEETREKLEAKLEEKLEQKPRSGGE